MRDVLIAIAVLGSSLGMLIGAFGLFIKAFRPKAWRIMLLSTVALIGFIILVGTKNEDWARQDGFLNAADKSAAQKAGVTDATLWPARRKELEEEAARNEARAKAAGFDDYAAQQAAKADGITTGPEWKKRLAHKLAEEEAKKRYPLKLAIFSFASDYQFAAMQIGVSTRFEKVECPSGAMLCRYASGNTQAIVSSRSDGSDRNADEITLIFNGNKSEIAEFLLHIGIVMATVAPEASRDERGAALKVLTEGPKRKEAKGETTLHGIRFRLEAAPGLGLWLFVKDARVKEKG